SVVLGLPCSSLPLVLFFLDTTATPATCTLSLHDALPIFDDTLYLERDYVRSGFHAVGEHLRRTHGVDGFSRRAWELFESGHRGRDRKSTRLNSSHVKISYAVFCLKKKTETEANEAAQYGW